MKQNETNHGVEMGGRVLPTSTKNINKKTQPLEATVKAGINGIMVTPWKQPEIFEASKLSNGTSPTRTT